MKKSAQSMILLFSAIVAVHVLSLTSLSGQDVKSIDLKKIKNDNYLYVIGGQDNSVFAGITDNYFVQPDNKFPAMVINLDNDNEEETTIKPEAHNDILYTFYHGGKLYALEYGDKPLDNGMYRLQIVSFGKDLQPLKTYTDTMQMTSAVFRFDFASMFKNQFSPESGKWRRSYIFSHKTAPDGKRVIIMLNNSYQSSPPRVLYYLVFNTDTGKIEQYQLNIPSDDANLIVEDYALTNDGNVFLLATGFSDNSFTKKPGTFRYYLYNYNPVSNTLTPVEINASDHFVTNLGLILAPDGSSPRLAGLYSDDSSLKVQGIAGFSMDSNGSMKGIFTPLDEDIVKTLYADEDDDNDQADEYDVRYIFPETNGDVTFFAEHYSRKLGVGVDISLFKGVEPKPQLEDHYGNIIISRVKPDGSPAWTTIIEKNQKSTDENITFNSFAVARNADNYGLIFNEQVKNMSDVAWVNLKGDGTKERKLIFERKEDRLRVAPMLAADDNSGDLFVPAVRFSKTKLVRIKF